MNFPMSCKPYHMSFELVKQSLLLRIDVFLIFCN